MQTAEAITLKELNIRLGRAISSAPDLTDVWVTAETSDLRVSGGHCYMELLQKNPDTQAVLAKARAVIWANNYGRLSARFAAATGNNLRSDIKIMVRATVSFHAVYGLSLVISDIDPDYTAGDLVRKRNMILQQLQREGVAELNRSLTWPRLPVRVAVISAAGAAGYGDFLKHLHLNAARLRFTTTLFEAAMQGERTAPAVIAAMERIMDRIEEFDCVVIIRGGGAVSDLASFDDYDLAANVAQFPLPVVVGIGHERDVTVLDYVACQSVKTPTAAAELLLHTVEEAYGKLMQVGADILEAARARIAGAQHQLAYCQGLLPALAIGVIEKNRQLIGRNLTESLASAARNIIERNRQRIGDAFIRSLEAAARNVTSRNTLRLDAIEETLALLSPEATLRRGYSITRVNGHAVTDSSVLNPDDILETTFADGKPVRSKIQK